MNELTIVTLCQILSNLTHQCSQVENSNTCRCVGNIINQMSPAVVGSTAPDIMLSEIILILFVLAIWLSAIGFCLNQYKSLRRLETQAHYCIDRKDPLNIGDIKIVAREQDSIIYKKKRYSTLLDPNMNHPNLQAMHYVQQYLPKRPMTTIASTLSALVIDENDLTCKIPLSATTGFHSSIHTPLNTHDEEVEYQTLIPNSKIDTESSSIYHRNISNFAHKEHARHSTALTIPCISIANSLHSSWNTSQMYDASCSAQLLSVPINNLRTNRHSDGNISLPVPHMNQNNPQHFNEQLLDPRLIPDTVRRSLLALHRESQENINLFKRKDKTQSENDVHGALTPWKMKVKSKLKHTHPQLEQTSRPHAHTLSILPFRLHYNNYERYPLENIPINNEYQNTRSTQQHYSVSTAPSIRRSLKNYPKFSTQSTSESEGTQGELATFTSFYIPTNDDKLTETIIELTEKTP